jgi:single-strand DNA-binding protein
MNEVKLSGNLTRDPELKFLPSGTAKCSFTIAHNTGKDDKKKTHFFDCVAWKTTGEVIAEAFKKGQYIEIQGMLTQDKWQKDGVEKTRVEIVVFKVVEKEKKEETATPPVPVQGMLPEASANDEPF